VAKIGDTNKVRVIIRKMESCTIGSECMALGFCILIPPSSNQECVATVSGLSCPVSFQGVNPFLFFSIRLLACVCCCNLIK